MQGTKDYGFLRRAELWVQDVREDTMRNNHGKHFRRKTITRGNVVAGNVGGEHIINFDEDVYNSHGDLLALNVDNVFEADECDAFDSDMSIMKLHEMQTDEQHNYVVDSDADYTSNSNIIPYDQYVEVREGSVGSKKYDNNKKKAETSVPKPISALTVYPPNTPVKLVPIILPTKSQVKINLYVLTQLFTEFDKTCKTRITPAGVTEGERGVQTALFKEVKVIEEIFDQMNNEVDKNTVDKQCAEIVKKNLLIENENLIENCLVYSNCCMNWGRKNSRCLDLEADMSISS
ncbi:hypothetical protein Tco_1173873 [Tanacetum coccineum]